MSQVCPVHLPLLMVDWFMENECKIIILISKLIIISFGLSHHYRFYGPSSAFIDLTLKLNETKNQWKFTNVPKHKNPYLCKKYPINNLTKTFSRCLYRTEKLCLKKTHYRFNQSNFGVKSNIFLIILLLLPVTRTGENGFVQK